MDILLYIISFLLSTLFVNPLSGILVTLYASLWYILMDRGLINIILAIPTRPILVFLNVNNKVTIGTFWIEIIKAPISAYLGSYILLRLFNNNLVIMPFIIGLLIWSFNFHFIGGVFKNHALRTIMFMGVLVSTVFVLSLIR